MASAMLTLQPYNTTANFASALMANATSMVSGAKVALSYVTENYLVRLASNSSDPGFACPHTVTRYLTGAMEAVWQAVRCWRRVFGRSRRRG